MIPSDVMKMWNGKEVKPVTRQYKISFCMSCMNRLDDLRKTLPRNLEENKPYPYSNFVLLNYNSIDGLESWVKDNMMEHVKSGRLVYFKTTEPEYFDFCHARNVSLLAANADIVNNLDPDNYIYSNRDKRFVSMCLPEYINFLANQQDSKAIFAKSRQRMHGRYGFFKDDFINLLGGIDEGLKTYEDYDLIIRAWHLGFCMYIYSGCYAARRKTSNEKRQRMLKEDFFEMVAWSKEKSKENISKGIYKANAGREWGKATLIKNFTEEIKVGVNGI